MKGNRKLIALGACVVLGIGMAIPAVGGAAGAKMVKLAENALTVEGYGVSVAPKAKSLVPTNAQGRLPIGVIPKTVLTQADISRPGNRNGSLIAADDSGRVPNSLLPTNVARTDGIKDGQTVIGTVGAEAAIYLDNQFYGATAQFPAPIKTPLDAFHMGVNGGAIEDVVCTGTFEHPTAPAGHLCIYPGQLANNASGDNPYTNLESEVANIKLNGDQAYEATAYPMTGAAGIYGFRLSIQGRCVGMTAATPTASGPTDTAASATVPCTSKFYATWAYTEGAEVIED